MVGAREGGQPTGSRVIEARLAQAQARNENLPNNGSARKGALASSSYSGANGPRVGANSYSAPGGPGSEAESSYNAPGGPGQSSYEAPGSPGAGLSQPEIQAVGIYNAPGGPGRSESTVTDS